MSDYFKAYFGIDPKRTPGAEMTAKLIGKIDCTCTNPYSHVVFEEENIDDENIDLSISDAKANRENLPLDEVEPVLAALLAMKALDRDERETAIGIANGWLP